MSEHDAQNLEDRIEDLHEDVRAKHHEDRSIVTWLWRGILFGIGSTVGVALIFYLFLLVAQQLSGVPILGNALKSLEPLVKQTAETRVPNVENLIPPVPDVPKVTEAPAPAPISPSDQALSDLHKYYTITVADSWKVEATQPDGIRNIPSLVGTSPDFAVKTDDVGSETAYTAGARLTIFATRDTGAPTYSGVLSQHQKTIGGEIATETVYKPAVLTDGQLIEVTLLHDGLRYAFDLAYNPPQNPTAEHDFLTVLDSLKFVQ